MAALSGAGTAGGQAPRGTYRVGVAVVARWVAAIAVAALAATASPAAARTWRVGADAVDLAQALTLAAAGDVVELGGGVHRGPVVIDRALTLAGPGTIAGSGRGHTLRVTVAGVVVRGVEVTHSGQDLQTSDACVWLGPQAVGTRVQDVVVRQCCFGIYLDQAPQSVIERCTVHGSLDGQRSLRGNGIHLFDADQVVVRDNVIHGGRDGIYVGATERSRLERNRMVQCRFGVHYMYSLHNEVIDNYASDAWVGFALMQSHGIIAARNTAERNRDHGILIRDATDSRIVGNRCIANGEGLFFYSSVDNVIADNVVLHNGVGAKIWAGSIRNQVYGNIFIGNRRQIFYVSTADLVWGEGGHGNLWGDYLGWDQDGDGIGDRPYRVDGFVAHLLYRYPQAALLIRSPAMELLAMLSEKMPLWQVKTVVDVSPTADPMAVAARALASDAAAALPAAATTTRRPAPSKDGMHDAVH